MNKAVFLDRDGTINVDFGYVYESEKLIFVNGVVDSLKKLQNAGYILIVITNQSGIGRGYFTESDAQNFNMYLKQKLREYGVEITDFFMCIHSPEESCDCRKPSPKMINEAIKKYKINPKLSYMIGDKESDIHSGINAGVISFLISAEYDFKYWTEKILTKE